MEVVSCRCDEFKKIKNLYGHYDIFKDYLEDFISVNDIKETTFDEI